MLVITGRLQVRLKWVVARRASIVSKINYTFKWSITEKSERQETKRVKITTFVLFPQMPKWQINFSFKTHRNSTEKTVTWILKVVAKLIPWPVYQGFSCACGRMCREAKSRKKLLIPSVSPGSLQRLWPKAETPHETLMQPGYKTKCFKLIFIFQPL